MWLSLFGFIIGSVFTYFALMARRPSRKIQTPHHAESNPTHLTEKPGVLQEKEASSLKKLFSYIKNALSAISDWAELTKRGLQYIIGFSITYILITQAWLIVQYKSVNLKLLEKDADNLLKIVAVGLIVSTAVELAYMLFTDGPDEAIDPIITALAAILLLRLPSPTFDGEKNIDFTRIAEMLVYGLLIALMFWVRELYLNGKLKRKKLGKDQ